MINNSLFFIDFRYSYPYTKKWRFGIKMLLNSHENASLIDFFDIDDADIVKRAKINIEQNL